MPGRSPFPIHPAAFALFPIASLISANLEELEISDAGRAAAFVLLLGAILVASLSLPLRSLTKASIVASVTLLLFMSYGHAYSLLKTVNVAGFMVGRHRYMIPACIVLAAAASWWAARQRGNLFNWTRALNAIAGAALLVPTVFIVAHDVGSLKATRLAPQSAPPQRGAPSPKSRGGLPDIYYIITDMYVRSDVLSDQYHFDNSEFLEALRGQGFYIADQSESNYLWTHLSLASSLNMDYIPNLIPGWTQGSAVDAAPLVQHGRVRAQLEELGYSTVAFPSGLETTEWFDADYVLTPDISRLEFLRQQGAFNDLEGLLVHNSVLRAFEDLDAVRNTSVAQYIAKRMQVKFVIQREIILAAFENLARVPDIAGPKFVFAHILSPHGPYIFGPNGEERDPSGPFNLSSTDDLPHAREARLYGEQLTFISSKLEETITAILTNSDRPVIIILQADHGPGIGLDWAKPTPNSLLTRSAILNAYYLPADCREPLYRDITPVNTFRVIFNCILEESLPLLDDTTYFGYEEFMTVEEILARQ